MFAHLDVPLTKEGVEHAIFHKKWLVALGLDGLTTIFFQKFWDIIGSDVTTHVLNILNNSSNPCNNNQTFIFLIHKFKRPKLSYDFRPIFLFTFFFFKIVTKTIAKRLKTYLHDIISFN